MGSTPDSTTTTTNTQPWSGQEPYLQDVFAQARGLFEGPGAQFYPGQTVAGLTPEQMTALSGTAQRAADGSPLTNQAQSSLQGLLGGGIQNNPALGGYQDVANGGLNTGAANGAISGLMGSNQGPGQSAYQGLTQAGMGPGTGLFQGVGAAGQGPTNQGYGNLANAGMGPGAAGYGNIGYGGQNTWAADQAIGQLSNANLGPAAGLLGNIASGGPGSNLNDVFSSVQSHVQPAIASQYEAAGRTPTGGQGYAENLSRGLTEGFAPYALQAAQQGIQNQLSAAGQLQGAYGQQLNAAQAGGQLGLGQAGQNLQGQLAGLSGLQGAYGQQLGAQQAGLAGLQGNFQNQLNNQLGAGQALQGAYGQQLGAQQAGAAGLNQGYQSMLNNQLQGGQLGLNQAGQNAQTQLAGLNGLGNLYGNTQAQQMAAIGQAPGLANQDYQDLAQLFGVGSTLQNQNQQNINADVARYQYGQGLPAQQLAQYMQMVQGNYGGTTTGTQPYTGPGLPQQILGGLLGAAGTGIGIAGLL